jgi:two-component system response regulator PilR (NtrC family)
LQPRILVVDDDDTIRDTLYELLSEEYICLTAETAEQALARLEADVYDLVLTDISMPGLSGVELLGHIRQRFSDTPVIIVSGIDDREHAQRLIKLGAFDFLVKPFTLEKVEASVKTAVEYRRRLVEDVAAADTPRAEQAAGDMNDRTVENDSGQG